MAEKPHVLVVEDNPADVFLVEEALASAQLDCNVDVLRNGSQAIEFIEQLEADPARPRPAIVLLDLNLPKISGEEVLKRIRSSSACSAAKVLVISSSDTPADRRRAMQLGASGYFRKPSGLDEFMALGLKVRRLIDDKSENEPI